MVDIMPGSLFSSGMFKPAAAGQSVVTKTFLDDFLPDPVYQISLIADDDFYISLNHLVHFFISAVD